MTLPIILAVVIVAAILGLSVCAVIKGAPEGYEDDEGFHYGVEQDVPFHKKVWPGEIDCDLNALSKSRPWGPESPRNAITGQPLTPREQYDRECG